MCDGAAMAGDKQKSSLIGVMRLGVMVLLGDVVEVSPSLLHLGLLPLDGL